MSRSEQAVTVVSVICQNEVQEVERAQNSCEKASLQGYSRFWWQPANLGRLDPENGKGGWAVVKHCARAQMGQLDGSCFTLGRMNSSAATNTRVATISTIAAIQNSRCCRIVQFKESMIPAETATRPNA